MLVPHLSCSCNYLLLYNYFFQVSLTRFMSIKHTHFYYTFFYKTDSGLMACIFFTTGPIHILLCAVLGSKPVKRIHCGFYGSLSVYAYIMYYAEGIFWKCVVKTQLYRCKPTIVLQKYLFVIEDTKNTTITFTIVLKIKRNLFENINIDRYNIII